MLSHLVDGEWSFKTFEVDDDLLKLVLLGGVPIHCLELGVCESFTDAFRDIDFFVFKRHVGR